MAWTELTIFRILHGRNAKFHFEIEGHTSGVQSVIVKLCPVLSESCSKPIVCLSHRSIRAHIDFQESIHSRCGRGGVQTTIKHVRKKSLREIVQTGRELLGDMLRQSRNVHSENLLEAGLSITAMIPIRQRVKQAGRTFGRFAQSKPIQFLEKNPVLVNSA
jgi:hypothetical protein